jgi:hypothetical protein
MDRPASSVDLSEDLVDFLTSGVAVVVGSASRGGVPEVARGWGVHVRRPDVIEICLEPDAAGRTLENLDDSGLVAATFALPTTYRSLQIKGRCLSLSAASAEDNARVERHREAVRAQVGQMGMAVDIITHMWTPATVKLAFTVEQVFDQTPGPGAGAPL